MSKRNGVLAVVSASILYGFLPVFVKEILQEGMTDADQMLIHDVAYAEQVKQMLMDDIAERGLGQERYNGRQKYWQENKSPAQFRAYCEQQRKILAELRLTPAGRKAEKIEIDDDFENFPD